MADEQVPMPMEQEPSKAEPPETGAGYDDADEARAGQPASPRNAPLAPLRGPSLALLRRAGVRRGPRASPRRRRRWRCRTR